jgi:hypothetical protein
MNNLVIWNGSVTKENGAVKKTPDVRRKRSVEQ